MSDATEARLTEAAARGRIAEAYLTRICQAILRLQASPAYKVLLVARRFQTEVLKGDRAARARFVAWAWLKACRQSVPENLSLNHFDLFPAETQFEALMALPTSLTSFPTPTAGRLWPDIVWFVARPFAEMAPATAEGLARLSARGQRVFVVEPEPTPLGAAASLFEHVAKFVVIDEVQPDIWRVRPCAVGRLNIPQAMPEGDDRQFLRWSLTHVAATFGLDGALAVVEHANWEPIVSAVGLVQRPGLPSEVPTPDALLDTDIYPAVSIVIVTYNNWDYTRACLASLYEYTRLTPRMEVIVVDNNSTDGTRDELSRLQLPHCRIVLNDENLGFAGGNNVGCRVASGDYLILLNNDTLLAPGWVERLIAPLRADPVVGMTGPVSNSVGNDQMVEFFVGDARHGADPAWLQTRYRHYRGLTRTKDTLGFYCVAVRRDVYERVGELDERFGLGMFEDDDYCARVRQAGYELRVVEDAFVYHHGSASFKLLDEAGYQAIWERNLAMFEAKWGRAWARPTFARHDLKDAIDPQAIAEQVTASGRVPCLVLGLDDWRGDDDRRERLVKALGRLSGLLVIANARRFSGAAVGPHAQIGPHTYLSDDLSLYARVHFQVVVYAGSLTPAPGIAARRIYIDNRAYSMVDRVALHRSLGETTTIDEAEVDALATHVARAAGLDAS